MFPLRESKNIHMKEQRERNWQEWVSICKEDAIITIQNTRARELTGDWLGHLQKIN